MCILAGMLEKARRRILALLDQPGMNKVLLANKAGVHRNTLNDIEKASWNPAAQTLDAILGAVERLEKA
jgi:DNA-binding XRE family transcriptional regulator